MCPEDVQAAYAEEDRDDNSLAINVDRIESIGRRILAILAGSPDGLQIHTLKGVLFGVPTSLINAALPVLLQSGGIYQEGRGPMAVYRAMREPGED